MQWLVLEPSYNVRACHVTESLAVTALNEALDGDDAEATMTALQNPVLQLPLVCNFAAPLYHEEFRNMKAEKQVGLWRHRW